MQRVRRPLQTLYIIPQKIKSPAVTKHRVYKKKKSYNIQSSSYWKKHAPSKLHLLGLFPPKGNKHIQWQVTLVLCVWVESLPHPLCLPGWGMCRPLAAGWAVPGWSAWNHPLVPGLSLPTRHNQQKVTSNIPAHFDQPVNPTSISVCGFVCLFVFVVHS